MSVLSYLDNMSSTMVLTSAEKSSISTSINTIRTRINSYLGTEVREQLVFGSYTRETILPRKYDNDSDVDYMIVFYNNNGYKPQTLLNKLKQFVELYYSRSEIHQSHPTIVLELSHIKIELVPAIKDYSGNIFIPSPANNYADWMLTDPNGFNSKLTNVNGNNYYKIKPLIRLMKYWNVDKANKAYSSYVLEKWIIDKGFWGCNNLKDYLFSCINDLCCNSADPQYLKNAVANAKSVVENVKYYERVGDIIKAENEIKKIIPYK